MGFQRPQGALLRQIRQLFAVGTGRNAHRARRQRLPVPDRRRAGIAGLLRGSRRRALAHLQAERGGSALGQAHPGHLSLPLLDRHEGRRWRDPGGDLRAVEGTTAEVAIQTDRPLSTGALLLDDGTKLLAAQRPGWHADGQRADPEGRPVSRRRGRRRRRRAAERGLFHRGAEGPAAGSQDHPAGPRFQGHPDRGSHRGGGCQGRFRSEGRGPALFRERRSGEDGFRC